MIAKVLFYVFISVVTCVWAIGNIRIGLGQTKFLSSGDLLDFYDKRLIVQGSELFNADTSGPFSFKEMCPPNITCNLNFPLMIVEDSVFVKENAVWNAIKNLDNSITADIIIFSCNDCRSMRVDDNVFNPNIYTSVAGVSLARKLIWYVAFKTAAVDVSVIEKTLSLFSFHQSRLNNNRYEIFNVGQFPYAEFKKILAADGRYAVTSPQWSESIDDDDHVTGKNEPIGIVVHCNSKDIRRACYGRRKVKEQDGGYVYTLLNNVLPISLLSLVRSRVSHISTNLRGKSSFFLPFLTNEEARNIKKRYPDAMNTKNVIEKLIVEVIVPTLFGSEEKARSFGITGAEWWVQVTGTVNPKEYHMDTAITWCRDNGWGDMVTACPWYPSIGSVFYLDDYEASTGGGATAVFDQYSCGVGLCPAVPQSVALVYPVANQMMLFQGNRFHGVMHGHNDSSVNSTYVRRTLLINYWSEDKFAGDRSDGPLDIRSVYEDDQTIKKTVQYQLNRTKVVLPLSLQPYDTELFHMDELDVEIVKHYGVNKTVSPVLWSSDGSKSMPGSPVRASLPIVKLNQSFLKSLEIWQAQRIPNDMTYKCRVSSVGSNLTYASSDGVSEYSEDDLRFCSAIFQFNKDELEYVLPYIGEVYSKWSEWLTVNGELKVKQLPIVVSAEEREAGVCAVDKLRDWVLSMPEGYDYVASLT